jgi:hypothetical protein
LPAAVLAHAFELTLCNEVKADYYLPDGTLKPNGTCLHMDNRAPAQYSACRVYVNAEALTRSTLPEDGAQAE